MNAGSNGHAWKPKMEDGREKSKQKGEATDELDIPNS